MPFMIVKATRAKKMKKPEKYGKFLPSRRGKSCAATRREVATSQPRQICEYHVQPCVSASRTVLLDPCSFRKGRFQPLGLQSRSESTCRGRRDYVEMTALLFLRGLRDVVLLCWDA